MKRLLVLAMTLLAASAHAQPRVGLREVMKRAEAHNATALAAAQEVVRSEGLLGEAKAAALPNVAGTASYTRLEGDRLINGRLTAAANQLYAAISLQAPIFAPQKWVLWQAAQDQITVAKAGAAEVRWQVAVAAARLYLGALAQQQVIDALEAGRETAARHLQFAQGRRAGGVGNQLDVARASRELAVVEGQLANAQATLTQMCEQLGVLAGEDGPLTPDESVDLPAAGTLQTDPVRPDVVAARERLRAATWVRERSWTDWLPVLSASLAPFATAPEVAPTPVVGYQAQLVLTVPILDLGQRSGQKLEREAVAAGLEFQLEGVLRQARSEIRAAAATIDQADRAVAAAHEALLRAQEALQLADKAYKAGVSSDLEVIDAEQGERAAAIAEAQAQEAARQARLDLLVATGALP